MNYLVFLGKYNEDLCSIEERIINMGLKSTKYPIKYSINSKPDFVYYPIEGYEFKAWTFTGNVTPLLNIRPLIVKVKIIIFIFDLNDPTSLSFLKEGWGPIFDIINDSVNPGQKRILVGTQSDSSFKFNPSNFNELIEKEECINFDELIEKTKNKFKCSDFIIEIINSEKSKLIDLLKDQIQLILANERRKEEKRHDSKMLNQPKLIDHSKGQIQSKAKNAEVKAVKEKDDRHKDEDQIEQEELNEPIQDIEDENPIKITDGNYIDYLLFTKSKTAHILKISPKVKKEIFIPKFIIYKQKEYNITKIRDYAFKNSQIQVLSFSDDSSLQRIGNYAFEGSKLKKLIIPSSVEIIDEFCFEGCPNLEEIEVKKNNRYFSANNFFLYYFPNEINYNEPADSQVKIRIFAKANATLNFANGMKATFTKNLLTINHESLLKLYEPNHFMKCQNIHHIKLDSNKIGLPKNFFNQNVHLQTIEIACKKLIIGDNCFTNCPNLSSISFHNLNKAIIGQRSFNGCGSLKSIEINCSNHLELKEMCFSGNRSIKTIKISCQEIYFGENCFLNSSISSILISKSKTIKFGRHSLTNCLSLIEIQIFSDQLEIGDYCFCRSNKLKNVTIKGVQKLQIPEGCFENCTSLNTFSISDATDVILCPYAFKGCSQLNRFLIPKAISISIAQKCFEGATQLKSIEHNCSEIDLYENSFDNAIPFNARALNKIKTLTTHIINNNFKNEVINKFSSIETIIIESEQELTIKRNTFDKFKSLKRVDINTTSILTIEKDFDFNNNKINSIELNSETIIIGPNSFNKAKDLDILSINSNQIKIDEKCFNNLPNLQTICLEGERLIVGDSCFQNCSKFENLTMKNINYVFLGFEAFKGCNRLNSIDINPSKNILAKYFTIKNQIGTTKSSCQVEEKFTNNKLFAKSAPIETDTKEKCSSFFKHMLELAKLNDDLILPIEGFSFYNFDNKPYATIFTVFISKFSLAEAMHKDILSNVQKYSILIGLAIGMRYLHSKSIIHTNLKPSNIFLDKQLHPHISEYSIPPLNKTKYTPPEIANGSRYSFEDDIYSYSIIAIELLTGPIQFDKDNNNKKFVETILGRFKDPHIRQFFERCISATQSNRPSFDDIYDEIAQHRFIKSFNMNLTEINTSLEYYRIRIRIKYQPEETNVKQESKIPNESKKPPIVLHNASSDDTAIKSTKPSQQLPINDSLNNQIVKSPKHLQQSPKNNKLTIFRYLKPKLFNQKHNLLIIKIDDKTKIRGDLKSLVSKIIQSKSTDFLYYTISKDSNYSVNYFETDTLVQDLPSSISIQMRQNPFRNQIFVVCNIKEIEEDFQMNENCFTIAIGYDVNDNSQTFKEKIIYYLQMDLSITNGNPIFYFFKDNQFHVVKNIMGNLNKNIPIFISFKEDDLQQIKKHISQHVEIRSNI